MYHNIEKSAFLKGEYVGHATGVWHIYRIGTEWRCLPSKNVHPGIARHKPYGFSASTLKVISAELDRINTLPKTDVGTYTRNAEGGWDFKPAN